MKIIVFSWVVLLCFTPLGVRSATNQVALRIAWPSPPEALIDLVVPPTRVTEPYAASLQNVYVYRNSETKWDRIFSNQTEILGIAGYAKNSSVLYVAHSGGISTTPDGGITWVKAALPSTDLTAQGFVGINVNPKNRREAIWSFTNEVFITRDFGRTWNELNTPREASGFRGAGFAGTDPTRMVLCTDTVIFSGSDGEWTAFPIFLAPPLFLHTSAAFSEALVGSVNGSLTLYDFAGSSAAQASIDTGLIGCRELVPDLLGSSFMWAACGQELRLCALKETTLNLVTGERLESPIGFLRGHPRSAGSVFVVPLHPSPLLLASTGKTGTSDTIPWGFSSFTKIEGRPAPAKLSADRTASELEFLMNKLISTEPPLENIILAALDNAGYSPTGLARWKKQVRRRHWIPELRISGGVREYPIDQIETFDYVDRYGIPRRGDLRLSDQTEPMNSVSVALVWNLSKLLFDKDELDVNEEKREELKQRDELIEAITTLYYERLDLLARKSFREKSMNAEDRISLYLNIRKKTDMLNHLIGTPLLRDQASDHPLRGGDGDQAVLANPQ